MPTFGHHFRSNGCHLPCRIFNFHGYLTCCLMFSILLLLSLPWSVSTSAVTFPCDNGGPYESITCSPRDNLIVTLNGYFFKGDCSGYPFYVELEAHPILTNRKPIQIIATLVDTDGIIYFFQKSNQMVVIHEGRRIYEKPIGSIFKNFVGAIKQVVLIPKPIILDGSQYPVLVTLYTEKQIFYYVEKKMIQGLPIWNNITLWDAYPSYPMLNKTLPPITRILGVSRDIVKTTLASDSKENELFYSAKLGPLCSSPPYRYNLTECLEDNTNYHVEFFKGQLIKCTSHSYSGPDLLSVMLYGSLFLIVLAILGLIKCLFVWIFKKCRRTRHKAVRFREDVHKGDPKKSHILLTYGIDHPSARIQTFDFDSVGQSAVSINEEYKDINYSSDVEEDEITIKENDSKQPLEPIQSPDVI